MALEGRIARLGALLTSPRRLARRDLEAQDGKAGDDLILLALVALVLDGSLFVVRAASALAAGLTSTALHALASVVRPVVPLVGGWALASLAFLLFTLREPRRAAVELGARVIASLVLVSLLVAPLVELLVPSLLRTLVQSLPFAVALVVFGFVLHEALEREPSRAPAPRAFVAGGVLVLLIAATGLFLFDHALVAASGDQPPVSRGAMAPNIDLPLLQPGARLKLVSLRGTPVILSFWATWCGPCLAELPVLERLQKQRSDDAPPIFLVNVDEPGPERERAVRGVVQRLGLTMPVVLDDGSAGTAYAVEVIPTLVRVGADGKIEHRWDRPLEESTLRDALRK